MKFILLPLDLASTNTNSLALFLEKKNCISADIFINQIHIYKNIIFSFTIKMALFKDEDLYVCKRHTNIVAKINSAILSLQGQSSV